MRINEIENTALRELKKPKFSCDKLLSKHILPPIENQYFFTVFCGVARSGKTSLALSMLLNRQPRIYRNVFNHILVFMPVHSINSLQDDPFEDLDPEKKFPELTITNLMVARQMILENSENNERTLLFLDDMASFYKNHETAQILNDIIQNRRHYKCSIMLITQYYNAVPLTIRKNLSSMYLFKCSNKEWENVREELLQMDRDTAQQIRQYIFRDKHDFMLIKPLSNEIFRNFNKLELDENI